MTFEEYLSSKKIDSAAFKNAEPQLWQEWNSIFEEVSVASFTAQKLYLINPIRRKYQLREIPVVPAPSVSTENPKPVAAGAARPVFRPKPKM